MFHPNTRMISLLHCDEETIPCQHFQPEDSPSYSCVADHLASAPAKNR